MPRFFVKNNQINNDKITIIDEDVKHIKNVLRKQIGDKIEVCNQDTGKDYKIRNRNKDYRGTKKYSRKDKSGYISRIAKIR